MFKYLNISRAEAVYYTYCFFGYAFLSTGIALFTGVSIDYAKGGMSLPAYVAIAIPMALAAFGWQHSKALAVWELERESREHARSAMDKIQQKMEELNSSPDQMRDSVRDALRRFSDFDEDHDDEE